MTDFTQLSSTQIVDFIESNFEIFATHRSNDFPDQILRDLENNLIVIEQINEGFAIAFTGRKFLNGGGGIPAALIFLYIAPEFKRKKLGSSLIKKIKLAVTPNLPIKLTCEGFERMNFFKVNDFIEDYYDREIDTYHMLLPQSS